MPPLPATDGRGHRRAAARWRRSDGTASGGAPAILARHVSASVRTAASLASRSARSDDAASSLPSSRSRSASAVSRRTRAGEARLARSAGGRTLRLWRPASASNSATWRTSWPRRDAACAAWRRSSSSDSHASAVDAACWRSDSSCVRSRSTSAARNVIASARSGASTSPASDVIGDHAEASTAARSPPLAPATPSHRSVRSDTARHSANAAATSVRWASVAGRLGILFEIDQLGRDRGHPGVELGGDRRRSVAVEGACRRAGERACSLLSAVDRVRRRRGGATSGSPIHSWYSAAQRPSWRISSSTPLTNCTRSTLPWLTPMPYGSSVSASPTNSRFGSWAARPTSSVSSLTIGVGAALLHRDQAVGGLWHLDELHAVVLRLAHLVEGRAAGRHAHPGAGVDEVLHVRDAGPRRHEHLLAGVVVRRRERDAQPAVAVDRHRVGDEVDVVVLQRGQALGEVHHAVLDRQRVDIAEDGASHLLRGRRCRSRRARRSVGLRKPNCNVPADTPTISRPSSGIRSIVEPAGISPGGGSGPSGAYERVASSAASSVRALGWDRRLGGGRRRRRDLGWLGELRGAAGRDGRKQRAARGAADAVTGTP